MILPLQEIRDLLPTAVVLACPQIPDPALDRGRDLASPSRAFLGLRMTPEKAREPIHRNAFQP